MKSETIFDAEAMVIATPLTELAEPKPDDTIDVNSCSELEWIVVTTRRSVYDIVVLSAQRGDVLIRGGRFLQEFRPATLIGSISGGSAIELDRICIGLCLELSIDGECFVTSRVQGFSRHRLLSRRRLLE